MKADEPTVRQQELGEELRVLRKQAGFTLDDAARIISCSASKLSRIETGHRNASLEDIASLLGLYHADHTQRTRILALARESNEVGWLQFHRSHVAKRDHALMILESKADQIVLFDPVAVPALLQTDDYMAALLGESRQSTSAIDERAVTRCRRQSVFHRQEPPKMLAVLDESVLHRPIGGRDVLRRQVEHLHESGHSHWTIRVLPRDQKINSGPFTLLRLRDRPPVVALEHLTCSLFLEQSRDIDAYEYAVERLDESALDEAGSLELIASVAKCLEA